MTYVDGFLLAVREDRKEEYRNHAASATGLFHEFGATRMVENWGADVPDGQVTDFRRAVKAEEGEAVLFSWVEYPDRAIRDAAMQKMMSDPRMEELGDMPFDGKRMVMGGFEPMVVHGQADASGFVDGFVIPVPPHRKEDYRAMAEMAAPIFLDHGALQVVEAWGTDVPRGVTTDFYRAVSAEGDEGVVFSWVIWPDRAARDAGNAKVMNDPRMKGPDDSPFNPQRMIFGGFETILDA